MAAKAAYPAEEITEAGHRILRRAETPTPATLHRELGRRGTPATAWPTWQAHAAQEATLDRYLDVPLETPTSVEMAQAQRTVLAAVQALLDRQLDELTSAHEREVKAQRDTFSLALRRNEELDAVVDGLVEELGEVQDYRYGGCNAAVETRADSPWARTAA